MAIYELAAERADSLVQGSARVPAVGGWLWTTGDVTPHAKATPAVDSSLSSAHAGVEVSASGQPTIVKQEPIPEQAYVQVAGGALAQSSRSPHVEPGVVEVSGRAWSGTPTPIPASGSVVVAASASVSRELGSGVPAAEVAVKGQASGEWTLSLFAPGAEITVVAGGVSPVAEAVALPEARIHATGQARVEREYGGYLAAWSVEVAGGRPALVDLWEKWLNSPAQWEKQAITPAQWERQN